MTHEKRCPHGLPYSHETFDAKRTPPVQWCVRGRSVVTPPAECEWCDQGIEFAGSEAMNRCRAGCAVTHLDFAHYSDTELGMLDRD